MVLERPLSQHPSLKAGSLNRFMGSSVLSQEDTILISVLILNPGPSQAQGEACGCYDYGASQQSLVPKKDERGLGSDKGKEYVEEEMGKACEGRG